jgi:hypothetical protein
VIIYKKLNEKSCRTCGDLAYIQNKGMWKAFGWLLNKAMLFKNAEMYFLKLFFSDFSIFSAFDIARNDFVTTIFEY